MPLSNAPPDLVILDFDGVVADSELLANTLLAEFLTGEGLPTTLEQSMAHYMGRRWIDAEVRIAANMGRPLPPDFHDRYRAHSSVPMRARVEPVDGVVDFLARHAHRRFCVASSSTPSWLEHGVDKFGLRAVLGDNLFSATAVARGKPAPDIFLHAAERMRTPPHRCAVIEDSPAGVEGAVAAGMMAIGFLGGSHVGAGHRQRLVAAGAHGLARTYPEVAALLRLETPSAVSVAP